MGITTGGLTMGGTTYQIVQPYANATGVQQPPATGVLGATGGGPIVGPLDTAGIGALLSQLTEAVARLGQALQGGTLGGGPIGGPMTDAMTGCNMPGAGTGAVGSGPVVQAPSTDVAQKGGVDAAAKGGAEKGGKGKAKKGSGAKKGSKHVTQSSDTGGAHGTAGHSGAGKPKRSAKSNPPSGSTPSKPGKDPSGSDGAPPTPSGSKKPTKSQPKTTVDPKVFDPANKPTGKVTDKWRGVTGSGWYTWTSPDNMYHRASAGTKGAFYLVKDGSGYRRTAKPENDPKAPRIDAPR